MKNNQRMTEVNNLSKENFLHEVDDILNSSIKDPDVSFEDHRKLFELFMKKLEEFFPSPDQVDAVMIKRICWFRHSKEDPNEKKQTLREQLQARIDGGDIYDARGKISPETLWMFICHFEPELKDKYKLDGEYAGEKDSKLSSAVTCYSASLIMNSKKTAHLRH